MAPVEILFEWEDDGHVIDAFGNPFDPTRAPRPNLWADIIQHRYAEAFGSLSQFEVEFRIIDQDQKSGLGGP